MDWPPEEFSLSRRTLLKGLGIGGVSAAALVGWAGSRPNSPTPDGEPPTETPTPEDPQTTPTPSEPTETTPEPIERHDITFEREVDAVDDLGVDPTGTEPITDAIEGALEAGTLVTFPDGRYQLAARPFEIPGDNIGFLGTGDVTWQFAHDYHGVFVDCDQDDFLFEGIDIDMSGTRWESGHMRVQAPSHFHVENVAYIGRGQGPGYALKPGITEDPDGVGVIRNVQVPHGARPDMYASSTSGQPGNGRIGIYVGATHVGTLQIRDSEFSEFGNNAIYASRTSGNVQVEDSYFLNNGIAGIRLSGAGSWAKRCTVEIDTRKYDGPPLGSWGTWGIIAENTRVTRTIGEYPPRPAGMLVEDCTVSLREINSEGVVGAGIKLASSGRSLTVRDTDVHVDIASGFGRSTHAVLRVSPYLESQPYRSNRIAPPKPHWLRLENVTITGSAGGDAAVRVAEAAGSSVENCRIRATGPDRDGVRFLNAPDSTVEGGTIRADRYPLVVSGPKDEECLLRVRDRPALATSAGGGQERLPDELVEPAPGGSFPQDWCLSLDSLSSGGYAKVYISDASTDGIYGSLPSS